MASKVANHLHRYKKVNLSRNGGEFLVYRCMKPACSHYVRLDFAEGKLCECNKCGEPMIITKAILRHSGGKPMTKPHCGDCVKKRHDADTQAIADFLSGRDS